MASRKNAAPIPNPFAIDYAPTDRATCKACDGRIGLDSLRFVRKVWSRFHDGFDELKYHLRCSKKYTSNLEEIRRSARTSIIRPPDTRSSLLVSHVRGSPVVQALKRRSDALWSLKELLMEVPKKQLLPILDANNIPYNDKKISVGEAAHIVADGFMFGKLPPCPICGNSALVQYGGEIRCKGYISATTKCVFSFVLSDLLRPDETPDNSSTGVAVADLDRKEILVLPEEAKRIPVFKQWKRPEGVEGCMQLGNPLREEDIPPKMELIGLSMTSVGATDPPKAELQVLIERHGGEYTEQLEARTTFLLVGDGDSHEFTKKYRDAKAAGVPIMHSAFVKALVKRKSAEPKLKLAECRKWKGPDDGPDPRPVVDPLFSKKDGKIYVDDYGNAFNCSTQFTDITTGINKYYSMQIVQSGKNLHFFTKWGRLGADDKLTNDYRQQSFGQDLDGAIELAGYETEEAKGKLEPPLKRPKLEEASASSTLAECTLPPAVRAVVELIFDRKLAEKLLTQQQLNLQKLPIDSISKRQLQEGYAVLQEIQGLLCEDVEQRSTLKYQARLADATNRFYIKIPHIFTHAQKPPVLDSLAKLRTKIEMMEQLLEVSVAQSLLTDALRNAKDRHPLDAQYERLRCKLEGEAERFDKTVGNRMLLWHGSRLYCFATSAQPHGLLVLCETALGKQRQLLGADYEAAAKCKKDGHDSVFGVGRMCPNPEDDFEIPSTTDGAPVRVCAGKSWNNSKAVEELKAITPGNPEPALMYNEYVVYDPRHVKIRYLLHVEFEFASFDLDEE
ncbi:hypothetical protein Emag_000026 [Eimeria magna]